MCACNSAPVPLHYGHASSEEREECSIRLAKQDATKAQPCVRCSLYVWRLQPLYVVQRLLQCIEIVGVSMKRILSTGPRALQVLARLRSAPGRVARARAHGAALRKGRQWRATPTSRQLGRPPTSLLPAAFRWPLPPPAAAPPARGMIVFRCVYGIFKRRNVTYATRATQAVRL